MIQEQSERSKISGSQEIEEQLLKDDDGPILPVESQEKWWMINIIKH